MMSLCFVGLIVVIKHNKSLVLMCSLARFALSGESATENLANQWQILWAFPFFLCHPLS